MKKRTLQTALLLALLAAVFVAGIWYFSRDGRSAPEPEDTAAPTAGAASAGIDPSVRRYPFTVSEESSEVPDSKLYAYGFFPCGERILRLERGTGAFFEAVDMSSGEAVASYAPDDLGYTPGETIAGAYISPDGALWTLWEANGVYSLRSTADGVVEEYAISEYPFEYFPEKLAAGHGKAVLLEADTMAVYDLAAGEMELTESVADFCLDDEGSLYCIQNSLVGAPSLIKRSPDGESGSWSLDCGDGAAAQVFFSPVHGLFTIEADTGRIDCRDSGSGMVLYTLFSLAEDTELDYAAPGFYRSAFAVGADYSIYLSYVETDFDSAPLVHTRRTWTFEPYEAAPAGAEAVTLTVTAPYKLASVASSLLMYQRRHPEVTFVWDTQYASREDFQDHSSQYAEQLALRLMTGDVGDILMLHGTGLDADAILKTDVMSDLSPYLEHCAFLDDLLPSALEALRGEDGAVRALPLGITPRFFIYNETLAQDLALELDADDLTWSRLLDLAQEWDAEGSPYSLFWSAADGQTDVYGTLYELLLSNLDSFSDSAGNVSLDMPWLREMLVQLAELGGSSALSRSSGGTWWAPGALDGTLLVTWAGAYYSDLFVWLSLAEENNSVTLRLVPMPRGEETGERQSYAFCWGIPSASENRDAAWDVLEFMVSSSGFVGDTYLDECALLNGEADRERFDAAAARHPEAQERHYLQLRSVMERPISRFSEPLSWYRDICLPVEGYLSGETGLDEALTAAEENWRRSLLE